MEKVQRQVFIAQYGDESGIQGQFYAITTSKGELIVIDGGNPDNADKVRWVIREHGDHVTAWVITHPHPDHVVAFDVIWQDLGDI